MLKRKYLLFLLIFMLAALPACGAQKTGFETAQDAVFLTFTDVLENAVILKERPRKVVSLSRSYAETWLLAGGELAGVTDDVITERKMELPDSVRIVGTIKKPDMEEILALKPDFVLLSPDIEGHVKAAQTLEKAGVTHAFFKVEQFEDYLQMLDICTDITGRKDLYEENGLKVREQIHAVISKADAAKKPSVLFMRAFSGGAKAKADDNMTCRMLEDLGTINIAAKHPSLLEDLSMEKIIEEDPDYIFVVTMGDSEKAIEALRDGIEKTPAWSGLSAVKNGRYIVLPKELFHYKPNARWGESYEYLAGILYPQNFE